MPTAKPAGPSRRVGLGVTIAMLLAAAAMGSVLVILSQKLLHW
jgi:hypothetical protein